MNRHIIETLLLLAVTAHGDIPYPEALEQSAITMERFDDLNKNALLLGNGDLNAMFYQRNGALCLRVSKNDIWDARVDTSRDPDMMKVDIAGWTWKGGGGNIPSWTNPYPNPRSAAVVRFGGTGGTVWNRIRAEGRVNEWVRTADGAGLMRIEGKAGASTGFQTAAPVADCSRLQFKISGTSASKYYVELHTTAGVRSSGWIESPQTEETVTWDAPANGKITAVWLYVMIKEGDRAENRIREITLTGGTVPATLVPGTPSSETMAAKLDLRRAVATAGNTTARALFDRNVLLIETDMDLSIEEIKSPVLSAAELGETDQVRWLRMKMPGDLDYAGMEYAMAIAANGGWKAVSLVTSVDTRGGDVRETAIRLARESVAAQPATLIARHEAEWTRFWSASGVRLDDPDFQRWWYRMLYYLRSCTAPHALPIGLYAGSWSDAAPWHGDYHHNYNFWQPYWTTFSINHPGLSDPMIDYLNQMLPRLKWLAKETYDCEGACVGISSFVFEPDPAVCKSKNRRQVAMAPWGYTMGMIGMSAQVLWHRHLFQPDPVHLKNKIYPVLKEAALFFCSFAEKCRLTTDGKVKLGPSYSPEHGNFGVANVPFDLAYARFTLNAAITAAGELHCDPDLVDRCRKTIERLPDYPTAPDAQGNPVVVDWTGCSFRQVAQHNITVPAVPVFPAEQVTWFSPEPTKELFRNTLRQTRHTGLNSVVMFNVAQARLSMPEALDQSRAYLKTLENPNGMFVPSCGPLVEIVGVAAMISEFLVQSVENTIRVFPCWPKEKDARFSNLRAQGGFRVSAELKDGDVSRVTLVSENGRDCTVMNPWPGQAVRFTRNGKPAEEDKGERLVFKTAADETIELKKASP